MYFLTIQSEENFPSLSFNDCLSNSVCLSWDFWLFINLGVFTEINWIENDRLLALLVHFPTCFLSRVNTASEIHFVLVVFCYLFPYFISFSVCVCTRAVRLVANHLQSRR